MDSLTYQCDDGNAIAGDGCSASCLVETGYRCSGGSSSSASVCVYEGSQLSLKLTYTERNGQLNQGVFTFYVYPPLYNLKKMNLGQCVVLDCDSAYTVTGLSYDLGTLKVTVDFS
jgi:cysteine-rich repeat protein